MILLLFLFLVFASPTWCMDFLESDKYSGVEGDEVTALLRNPQDFLGCVVDLEEPFIAENRSLPKEMWWIIAAYSGDNFHRIGQVSREINGHIKFLVPHLVLPDYPSVRNVLNCIKVIEKCEKAYLMLEGCGLEAPSLPAYRKQVKKLTDAEIYVRYAPVFWWNNGHKRLGLLRGIHDLDEPANLHNSFRLACSSFARDPLVWPLTAAALLGLSSVGVYHILSIWPEYLHEKNIAHLKYLHDYQIALNHTSSEEFPQSLLYEPDDRWARPCPFLINESLLFQCYEKCTDWYADILSEEYISEIMLPVDMCQNPNRTFPDYINFIHNVTSSISRVCGQNTSSLWSPWINENLRNFTTAVANIDVHHNSTPFPEIAKIKDHSLFIHVSALRKDPVYQHDGEYCMMSTRLYTYDPVCIARNMVFEQPTFPALIVSAWGITGGVLWIGFFIMMILGWCL